MGDGNQQINVKSLYFVKKNELDKVLTSLLSLKDKLKIISTINRINTLYMISKAGSGHIGSSFSSMDIFTYLSYLQSKNKNICFFSSKGHDAPALYSNMYIFGKIPEKKFHLLRRLNGLPGHPDITINGISTNTGSLGMGISKAKGMAKASRLKKLNKKYFVILGDGELQEGQIWESLFSLKNHKYNEITIIIDHNKIQSDKLIKKVSDLGNLKKKFESFGFDVAEIDGHSYDDLKKHIGPTNHNPKIIIANTIKGKGIDFMENTSIDSDNDDYLFHSGSPSELDYKKGYSILKDKLYAIVKNKFLINPTFKSIELSEISFNKELLNISLIKSYENVLFKVGKLNKKVVVLDADLYKDTGLKKFSENFEDRFVECGIAEQDMVSQAGGLALSGLVPICHSFSCFLANRPIEQIYNNSTENKKIIYVGSLAGVIPAGPGHSHQSVRDITLMSNIPNLLIYEPCSPEQLLGFMKFAIDKKLSGSKSFYLRLVSFQNRIKKTDLSKLKFRKIGIGSKISSGNSRITIIYYGLLTYSTAVEVKNYFQKKGLSIGIINVTWLNKIDNTWLKSVCKNNDRFIILENHLSKLSYGDYFISKINDLNIKNKRVLKIGLKSIPPCGSPQEVLDEIGFSSYKIYSSYKKYFK